MRVGYLGVNDEIAIALAAAGHGVRRFSLAPSGADARALDVLVVAGCASRLPEHVVEGPRLGTLNVHPSLLPLRRGPQPVRWAILQGDERLGVTVHRMTSVIDAGPIAWQAELPPRPHDVFTSTMRILFRLAAAALPDIVRAVASGSVVWRVQDEAGATYQSRVPPALLRLDLELDSPSVRRRVAAADDRRPCLEGPRGTLRLVQAFALPGLSGRPGTVLARDRASVVVATGEGALHAFTVGAPRCRVGDVLVGGVT